VTLRKITPAIRRRNTALVAAAAEATMGPMWLEPADLYAAARQCARYGRTKAERVLLLAMTGLINHDPPRLPPKGCGPTSAATGETT
jgi:hypothetical protein